MGGNGPGRLRGRTYTVGDDVRVTLEGPLGVAVLGLVPGEVPDDQAVVTATREEHVGAKIADQTSANHVPAKSIVSGVESRCRGKTAPGSPASVPNEPKPDRSRFAIVRTYFSIEVASEVTQPFCNKSVSACPVAHRDPPPRRRPRGRGHWQETSPPGSVEDLRGPQGCP